MSVPPETTPSPMCKSVRETRSTGIGVDTLLALLLGWLATVDSPTSDEPGHLAAGDLFDPAVAGLNLTQAPNPPAKKGGPVGPNPDSPCAGWHWVCVNNLHREDQRFASLRELLPVD